MWDRQDGEADKDNLDQTVAQGDRAAKRERGGAESNRQDGKGGGGKDDGSCRLAVQNMNKMTWAMQETKV